MEKNNFTRGSGLLEAFLAKQRANKANSFIAHSDRKGRVLDIGCGSYPYFLSNIDFKEKYGLDPSLKLSEINDKYLNLKVVDVTKNKFPFKDNYFNVVTMLAVFEHIEQDKLLGVLREIKRVLKKDGVFIITTPSPWSDKLLHFLAVSGFISKEEIHEHKHNKRRSEIESMLIQAGFVKNNIRSGFFEIYMNMWFTAIK